MINAKIKVIYPSGARLSFQCDNEMFIAEFNTGSYIFNVPRLGIWTIKVEKNDSYMLHKIEITDYNQEEEIEIRLPKIVYENGQFYDGFSLQEQNSNFSIDKGNFGLISNNSWLGITDHETYIKFDGKQFKNYTQIKFYLNLYWEDEKSINFPTLIAIKNNQVIAKASISGMKQSELSLPIDGQKPYDYLLFISSNCIGIINKIQVI